MIKIKNFLLFIFIGDKGVCLNKKHFVVAYGGKSTEHDISIITAMQVYYQARNEMKDAEVLLLYQFKDERMFIGEELGDVKVYKDFDDKKFKEVCFLNGSKKLYLKKKGKLKELFEVDYLINCFHGGGGEDGRFAGLLESNKIINSSSSFSALSVCMDKYLTKCVCLAASVPVIDFFVYGKKEWLGDQSEIIHSLNQFDFPVVVKPVCQGSSIGVSLATNFKEFESAAKIGFKYDDTLLVERAIMEKREFNVIAYKSADGKIETRIEEPEAKNVIVTFSDKYLGSENDGKLHVNKYGGHKNIGSMASQAKKDKVVLKGREKSLLIKYAKQLYNTLKMNGIVRFDFIYDKRLDKFYLGEINAVPGSLGVYFFEPQEKVLSSVLGASIKYWEDRFDKTDLSFSPCIFK